MTIAGALEPFLSELANGDDLLARLAALEQLLELSETATVPPALRARIAPHVLQLLEGSADPTLQQAAVPAVARLLQDGQDTALVAQVVSKLSVAVQVCCSDKPCGTNVATSIVLMYLMHFPK